MSKKYYCERCGEQDLDFYIKTTSRPFDIICSWNCFNNLEDEIKRGDWESKNPDENIEYKQWCKDYDNGTHTKERGDGK